jgi:hypothetical protein
VFLHPVQVILQLDPHLIKIKVVSVGLK